MKRQCPRRECLARKTGWLSACKEPVALWSSSRTTCTNRICCLSLSALCSYRSGRGSRVFLIRARQFAFGVFAVCSGRVPTVLLQSRVVVQVVTYSSASQAALPPDSRNIVKQNRKNAKLRALFIIRPPSLGVQCSEDRGSRHRLAATFAPTERTQKLVVVTLNPNVSSVYRITPNRYSADRALD